MESKEEYERLIKESTLFAIDKERDPVAYERESLKMIEYLYRYLLGVNEEKNRRYGLEIVTTAKACIKNYTPENGEFLHYFNVAWSLNSSHIFGEELYESAFIELRTETEKRKYIRYKYCCSRLGIDTTYPGFEDKVADELGISIDAVREMMELEKSGTKWIDQKMDAEEETPLVQYASQYDLVVDVEEQDNNVRRSFLDHIEKVFNQLQARQKPMMAMILTADIAPAIDEADLQYFQKKAFFDPEIYEEYCRSGEPIQHKDIAARFGVLEESLSRAWRGFKKKL